MVELAIPFWLVMSVVVSSLFWVLSPIFVGSPVRRLLGSSIFCYSSSSVDSFVVFRLCALRFGFFFLCYLHFFFVALPFPSWVLLMLWLVKIFVVFAGSSSLFCTSCVCTSVFAVSSYYTIFHCLFVTSFFLPLFFSPKLCSPFSTVICMFFAELCRLR